MMCSLLWKYRATMRGITYKCGKCLDASPTKILVKCLIYLTATNSIPSWSDMPHPAHSVHTPYKNTHTNDQSHQSFASKLSAWQSNIQDSDWVEGDCDLFQICLACKANLNKHKRTVCMCTGTNAPLWSFSRRCWWTKSHTLLGLSPCWYQWCTCYLQALSHSTAPALSCQQEKKHKTQMVHLFPALEVLGAKQLCLKVYPIKISLRQAWWGFQSWKCVDKWVQ